MIRSRVEASERNGRAATRPLALPGRLPSRLGQPLRTVEHDAAAVWSLQTPELIDLQRLAGNGAVSQLVQRDPTPNAAPAPATAKPAVTAAPNPLSDGRIKWIDELPPTIRFSIDGMGDDKLGKRIRAIDESLDKQRAAIDAAKTADEKKLATDTMASSAETKAKAEIEKVHGKQWAKGRLALMDYLGCSLGGDAGVERYYRSLVQFGSSELWVHPEAARRLTKVEGELAKEKIPMPETTVGFGLRGRHVHPRTEDYHPGMMTHSLGVAVDWEAYKNVHITDEQLMALIGAVTGRAHNMELPTSGLKTIVALGEQSMGNTLSAAQQKDAAKGDALIETVGKEFDRLEADSDMFRDSLTFKKEDLLSLHREIRVVLAPVEAAQERLKSANAKKKPAIQAEVEEFQTVATKKMVELEADLKKLFAPWLTALSNAAAATRKDADQVLKGKSLDAVLTEAGLKSKVSAVAAATKPASEELKKLLKETAGTTTKAQAVRTKIGGTQAYLAKSGSEREKTDWSEKLAQLDARAAAVLGRVAAVSNQAQVLRGAAPTALAASSVTKPRKPAWSKDFPAWEGDIASRETTVTTAEASLKTATATLSPDAVKAAETLRDERAANEAIRGQVTKPQFQQLQALKAKLWHLERASYRLLNDASFMFPHGDVRNPGIAQITGVLEENAQGKRADIGGGGFFGTKTSAKEAAAKVAAMGKGKLPSAAGFGKRFFQVMVKYGFEPAATWRTADSMHFQVRGLVDQIVPGKACEEPPIGAEEKAEDDKALAAITEGRTKAAAARTAGETFSTAAEQARKTWGAEGGA